MVQLLYFGEEVTTHRWHLPGIGISERISPSLSLSEVIDEIHRQGGLAIAAHPVRRFWSSFEPVLDKLGAELMYPLSLRSTRANRPAVPNLNGWNGADLADFFALATERGKHLTAIGSSDYHFGAAQGRHARSSSREARAPTT